MSPHPNCGGMFYSRDEENVEEMSREHAVVKIVEVRRGDEIGTLAAAIDRMGTNIRLEIEQLSAKA